MSSLRIELSYDHIVQLLVFRFFLSTIPQNIQCSFDYAILSSTDERYELNYTLRSALTCHVSLIYPRAEWLHLDQVFSIILPQIKDLI